MMPRYYAFSWGTPCTCVRSSETEELEICNPGWMLSKVHAVRPAEGTSTDWTSSAYLVDPPSLLTKISYKHTLADLDEVWRAVRRFCTNARVQTLGGRPSRISSVLTLPRECNACIVLHELRELNSRGAPGRLDVTH